MKVYEKFEIFLKTRICP